MSSRWPTSPRPITLHYSTSRVCCNHCVHHGADIPACAAITVYITVRIFQLVLQSLCTSRCSRPRSRHERAPRVSCCGCRRVTARSILASSRPPWMTFIHQGKLHMMGHKCSPLHSNDHDTFLKCSSNQALKLHHSANSTYENRLCCCCRSIIQRQCGRTTQRCLIAPQAQHFCHTCLAAFLISVGKWSGHTQDLK